MTQSRRVICKVRGCQNLVDGSSYYGRCWIHMWCAHCDVQEVRTGRVCDACRRYEQRHGRPRPLDLIELQRRRSVVDDG
jgi:hypothetical protein